MKSTLDLTQIGYTLTGAEYNIDNQLVHQLTAFLASEYQDPFVYQTPKSWWEMFKVRWFPKWLLKRFPAVFYDHEVTVKTLYPRLKSKLPLDLMGPYVQVMVRDKIIGSFMPDTDGLTPLEFDQECEARFLKELRDERNSCPWCGRSLWLRK